MVSNVSHSDVTIDELRDDMQSTVGFEQLEDNARAELERKQQQVYAELEKYIQTVGDRDVVVLPRPLEEMIADIYERKEQVVASKRAANRDDRQSAAGEYEAAASRPLTAEQESQMATVLQGIKSGCAHVAQLIGNIFSKRDKGAESAQRQNEAAEIVRLRDELKKKDDGPTYGSTF